MAEKKRGRPPKKGTLEDEKEKVPALGSDAKRSIAAIFLFTLSLLFLLAFIGQAGNFGAVVSKAWGMVLGWGKWPFIPLLVLIGVLLLRHHKTNISDTIKYLGLGFAFVSVLGLAHLFLGDSEKELQRAAEAGQGGGYIGYLLASLLTGAMGKAATFIILLSLFASGVIAAFNVSLVAWIARLRGLKEEDEEGEQSQEVGSDDMEVISSEASPDPAMLLSKDGNEEKKEEVLMPEEANVQNIRFAGEEAEALAASELANAVPIDVGADPTAFAGLPKEVRPVKRRPRIRWDLPPTNLLEGSVEEGGAGDIEQRKQIIVNTLKYFGIDVEPGEVQVGPTVTQYTFRPAVGVKLSRITTLNNDLALALAAHSIRIEAPIPGKSLVGIEVPNKTKAMVRLRNVLESRLFHERTSNLTLVLGKNVSGKYITADLGKMPHLLIAGSTNSGKSVCINGIILSLLYQNSPEDLKLILVDPKRVELSLYNNIPHLKTPVIVENKKVVGALKWAVSEMEQRYKILEAVGSRDLASYKDKVSRGERRRFVDPETNEVREEELTPLPQIVIVIDEMADLMLVHGKEVEPVIIRLAQMSRAVGIHLILATQKPLSEVITSLIKSNIPARIAFYVPNQIDSRTILDVGGAEKLLGSGDMLYSAAGATMLQRIQGAYTSENEVKRVVKFLVDQKESKGLDEIGDDLGGGSSDGGDFGLDGGGDGEENDPIYDAAKRLVIETQRVSTTYLQTYLKIGYPKAARITELLEKNNIIGPSEGGRRPVLVKSLEDLQDGKKYGDDPLADQASRDKFQF